MKSIPHVEWKWFGYPGHLIVSGSCQFRLCTQVGGYLISTVGDYRPKGVDSKRQTIGAGDDSFFETYVFVCKGGVCEAESCGCGLPNIDHGEIDGMRTATAKEATAKHNEMCAKYAEISKEAP